jgi:hypothetical protein
VSDTWRSWAGVRLTRIGEPAGRDRLLLINAMVLLRMLGVTGDGHAAQAKSALGKYEY